MLKTLVKTLRWRETLSSIPASSVACFLVFLEVALPLRVLPASSACLQPLWPPRCYVNLSRHQPKTFGTKTPRWRDVLVKTESLDLVKDVEEPSLRYTNTTRHPDQTVHAHLTTLFHPFFLWLLVVLRFFSPTGSLTLSLSLHLNL